MPSPTAPAAIAAAIALALLLAPNASASSITDFNHWTLVQNPADPDLTLSVAPDGSAATVTLAGHVDSFTDIGLASVNADDVASATQGFAFAPDTTFTLAVDYAVDFGPDAVGTIGLGLGVGENIDGTNSAGSAVTGFPGLLAGATVGRVDDNNQTAGAPKPATNAGSLFVTFNSITAGLVLAGDVTAGNSLAPNAASPTFFSTLDAIGNDWNGDDLLVSFFVNGGPLDYTGGTTTVTFTNLRVTQGSPSAVVPSPTAASCLALGLAALAGRRRRA